eukprot:scaffold92601_cov75-Cyclotella_meneghiniana.AAC.12
MPKSLVTFCVAFRWEMDPVDYRRVRIRVYQGQSICSVLRGIRFMRESSHGTNLCSRTLKKEKYEGLYIFSPLESTPSRRHGFAIAERYLGGDIYYLFLVPAKQFGIWPIQFCCASGLFYWPTGNFGRPNNFFC